ncbi:Uncharacterized protein XB16_0720 [Leptospira santarosai]|uniref:Uncharacterized protein n=1 Tax=Leptospira santarosai TaxID=28183 RepID=A0A2P1QQ68_9LEPT|nr:Uncharacterized protein XB16_0720 [Leptospira santarosai]
MFVLWKSSWLGKTIFEVRLKFKEKSIYFIEIISAKSLSQNPKRKGERFPQTTLSSILFTVLNHFLAEKISVRTPARTVLEQAQNQNRLGLFFSDSISDSNCEHNKNII